MKLIDIAIRNFRRLERVDIEFEKGETIFVGSNNSGKFSQQSSWISGSQLTPITSLSGVRLHYCPNCLMSLTRLVSA